MKSSVLAVFCLLGVPVLAPAAAAQSLPPTPSDQQCEEYVNALGRQGRGQEIYKAIAGPCAAAFERALAHQHEIRRNSL